MPPQNLRKSKSSDDIVSIASAAEKVITKLKGLITPNKNNKDDENEVEFLNELELPGDAYIEEIIEAIIKKKKLRRVTWLPTKNGEGHQILFNIEGGSRCDDTIRLLGEWGIGDREGTSVSVLPCTLYHEPIHEKNDTKTE